MYPISHVRVLMYSCTHCDEKISQSKTFDDYSTLAPYIKEYEAFCSEECAHIEYAARKANAS